MIIEKALKPTQEIYQNLGMLKSPDMHSTIKELSLQLNEEEKEYFLKESIKCVKDLSNNFQIYDDEFFYAILNERLEYIKNNLGNMKKTITVKVALQNLENQVYRTIQMPYNMTLADMVYIILTSLKATEAKNFIVHVDGKQYNSDNCDRGLIDDYASIVSLSEINLNKKSHMVLHYDLEEEYIFDIYIKQVEECHRFVSPQEIQVLSGRGYGIFEEGHALLNHYYLNAQEFLSQVKGMGLDDQDFFLEDFKYEDDNSNLLLFTQELRMLYEAI